MFITVFNKSGGTLSTPLGAIPNGMSVSQEIDQNKYSKILPELTALQNKSYITYFAGAQSGSEAVRATTGDVDVYVDANLGKDTNPGTQILPFLTIQTALNSLPKMLMHQATVHVATGTYTGFIVSGFSSDYGVQQTTGGLLIDGILVNSTLATGSATGTATSGTAGSGATYGTLTNTNATWTVNDLTGRFITTASPTNTAFVISSNTATTITVVGTWTQPTGSTTYTIQDPGTVVDTPVTIPATPLAASVPASRVVAVYSNQLSQVNSIVFRNLRFAASGSVGTVELKGPSGINFTQCQIRTPLNNANSPSTTGSSPVLSLTFDRVDIVSNVTLNGSNGGPNIGGGNLAITNSIIRNIGSGTSLHGLILGSAGMVVLRTFTGVEIRNFSVGLWLVSATAASVSSFVWARVRISCSTTSGIGIVLGPTGSGFPPATNQVGSMSTISGLDTTDISNCGTAIQCVGPANVDVVALSGSATTTGFDVRLGGMISYAKAGMTLTAGTNEVNIENGEVVGTFAAGTAGQARVSSVSGNYSRVVAR